MLLKRVSRFFNMVRFMVPEENGARVKQDSQVVGQCKAIIWECEEVAEGSGKQRKIPPKRKQACTPL